MSAEARILELMIWENWIKPFFSILMDKLESLQVLIKTNKDVSFYFYFSHTHASIKISSFFQIPIPFFFKFKKRNPSFPLWSLFVLCWRFSSGHTNNMFRIISYLLHSIVLALTRSLQRNQKGWKKKSRHFHFPKLKNCHFSLSSTLFSHSMFLFYLLILWDHDM